MRALASSCSLRMNSSRASTEAVTFSQPC
jgi:hypothetical protein